MYSLSFSHEFFSEVVRVAESMPLDERIELARHLGRDTEFWPKTEMFPWEVCDMVVETDTCTHLHSPVEVWITPDGDFRLDIP